MAQKSQGLLRFGRFYARNDRSDEISVLENFFRASVARRIRENVENVRETVVAAARSVAWRSPESLPRIATKSIQVASWRTSWTNTSKKFSCERPKDDPKQSSRSCRVRSFCRVRYPTNFKICRVQSVSKSKSKPNSPLSKTLGVCPQSFGQEGVWLWLRLRLRLRNVLYPTIFEICRVPYPTK